MTEKIARAARISAIFKEIQATSADKALLSQLHSVLSSVAYEKENAKIKVVYPVKSNGSVTFRIVRLFHAKRPDFESICNIIAEKGIKGIYQFYGSFGDDFEFIAGPRLASYVFIDSVNIGASVNDTDKNIIQLDDAGQIKSELLKNIIKLYKKA